MKGVNKIKNDSNSKYKTFTASDKVISEKISYKNRYGITIAANLYLPKDMDESKKYVALVIGTPYGGVKRARCGDLCTDNGRTWFCRNCL